MHPSATNPELLSSLFDEHAAPLTLFAAQWCEAPDDCVQEAFVELVRQAIWPSNVAAWLYRVVRNKAISRGRASRRRVKHETLAAALIPVTTQPAADQAITSEELAAALSALDEGLREVVVARTWGGLSFEQIAEVVGIATSSAHRRYEAGLAGLRERLGVTCQNTKPTKTKSRCPTS